MQKYIGGKNVWRPIGSFYVKLLTDRQTNKQTNKRRVKQNLLGGSMYWQNYKMWLTNFCPLTPRVRSMLKNSSLMNRAFLNACSTWQTNFNLLCVLLSLFCVGRAVRYVTNGSTYQKSSIVVRLFGNTDSKAASGDREVTKKGAYCREMASL